MTDSPQSRSAAVHAVEPTVSVEDVLGPLLGSTMSQTAGASVTLDAARYHLASGGKRVRAGLGHRSASAFGVSDADGVLIGATAELIHNASLVYDDLQDRDHTRRGRDAVWARFGPDVALCTGALLLSASYGALAKLSMPERVADMVAHTHRRTAHLIHGQTADLACVDGAAPSASQYEQIAADKSGVLFALPLELACIYSGHQEFTSRARRAANLFAVGYQIADDIADADEDLARGRLNYVSLLATEHGNAHALRLARGRSLLLLAESVAVAQRLPSDAGSFLAELATDLSARV